MRFRKSAIELELYLLGELDPEQVAQVESAAEDDPSLAAWISERRVAKAAFCLEPRRRRFGELVLAAGEGQGERGRWRVRFFRFGWGLTLAGALAVTMLAVFPTDETITPLGDGGDAILGIRVRGGLSVKAAIMRDGKKTLYDSGQDLHPGDQIRLNVEDPHGGFVTVLLEEEKGGVSVAYRAEELGQLSAGTHVLPGSLELDDKLGRERLYVILSATLPSEVDAWLREIESAHERSGFAHGWLPEGTARIGTIEYQKVARQLP